MNELQLDVILNAIKQFTEKIMEEMKLMRMDFIGFTSKFEIEIGIIKGYFNRIQKMSREIYNRVKLN